MHTHIRETYLVPRQPPLNWVFIDRLTKIDKSFTMISFLPLAKLMRHFKN